MKKFDKIRRLNKDPGASFDVEENVIIQEKIDGANFRVWLDEGELKFGSRNVVFDNEEGYGAFTRAVEYIKERKDHILPGYVYYFEAMIKHTLNYKFDSHAAAILIDIWCMTHKEYLTPQTLEDISYFETAPIVYKGPFGDWDGEVPQSRFGDFQAEGVVIKPLVDSYDTFGNIHRAKVVTDTFREENREVFGTPNDKESRFAIKYATAARIDKHINHLEDVKGEKVQASWIPILSMNITRDICDEEFPKLLKMRQPNLHTIKKEVERQVKLRLGQLGVL